MWWSLSVGCGGWVVVIGEVVNGIRSFYTASVTGSILSWFGQRECSEAQYSGDLSGLDGTCEAVG